MLERLYVKNIALIEEADIEFDKKLNVLSGETGSGKSVILDSINFVLGSKADKSMIRYGTEEAQVVAEFLLDSESAALNVLREFDIEPEEKLIISRKLNLEGKGSIKINGNTVTAAMLKKVAAHLVDVHGQSEHFFLLSENNQLSMVDVLCGGEILPLKQSLAELLSRKRQFTAQIAELGGSERERAQKLDLLNYQINEIRNAELKVGELEELKAKKKLIDNAEKVLSAVNAIRSLISDDNGAVDLLSNACKQAAGISDYDDEYEKLYERLDSLVTEAEDVSDTAYSIADNFNFDENEARETDERLALIKSLIKKYGADEESVLNFLEEAENQYDLLSDANDKLEKITAEIGQIDGKIYKVCRDITSVRQKTCKNFCKKVEEQLHTLNIPNAQFFVNFDEYDKENFSATPNGADKISFMFSANKGEPPKPLNKVISGGEMSRFMLAVKTQLKGLNGISTYIFDEIDAGISGVTATSVAEKFVAISKDTQIIAVSHLPQVSAAATAQYLISKNDGKSGKTVTKIKKLSRQERIAEIVRLTGSIVTDAAKAHAEELLKLYNN